ncbi:hypothetical protein NQ318_020397 [Aromia moschata]|uniref:Reverse transcriptase domain-containing protein n=1 Tax=Aromia moschata TaxID=1265417 RepID=A0AAV8Y2V3_9CUCU|nr:hypothetical protein NQ318_020397 [Aromia moschata]
MLNIRIPNAGLVGYANDLVAVVTAPDKAALEDRDNRALRTILSTAEEMGVTIAPQKTEAIVARGRRKVLSATFKAKERRIDTRETMKIAGGPAQKTRRILAASVYSVVLYAAPAWSEAMQKQCYRKKLGSIQRKVNIRVTQAYRTASSAALCVVAGYPPIEMMVERSARIYREGRSQERDINDDILRRWQALWTNESRGEWTRSLIPRYPAMDNKEGFRRDGLPGHPVPHGTR